MRSRRCSRSACSGPAVATLTFAYRDQTAVLGPLALQSEPGGYDLCREHAAGLSAPLGWEVIRLPLDESAGQPDPDDLLALADAVREVGFRTPPAPAVPPEVMEGRRKGHLVVLPDPGR
ncbi:DUF3499 domain-containing protein [Propionicicella superfundia]|uniref:DUF3499 domain-containing protein n=1 Tax=Propionicicella superfundia TaxID=348582 RepID=UPI000491DE9C|nr:DUF3499 domain-containing protein [Propionicicella superfundia]